MRRSTIALCLVLAGVALAAASPALSGTTTQYQYDALGRLVKVVSPYATTTYVYDAAGNRTAVAAVQTAYKIVAIPGGGIKLLYPK